MSSMSHINQLRSIIAIHDAAITALGERYRKEVIIPLCQRYKLYFVVVQGDFWFMKSVYADDPIERHNAPQYSQSKYLDDPVGHKYTDISWQAKRALRPVLDLLNEDIAHNNPFGYHVRGVD